METIANSQFFRTAFEKGQSDFVQRSSNGPVFDAAIKPSLAKESYHIHLQGSNVCIEGGSAAAIFQGAGLWEAAFASGHGADYLGKHEATYPCRWLYPKKKFEEKYLCKRLLQMGYNGVVLEQYPNHLQVFKKFGLEVALLAKAPDSTPFDAGWNPVFENLEGIQAVYWKGTYNSEKYLHHPMARDDLMIDLALREVKAVEEAIQGRCALVYELDPRSSIHWIPEFMDGVGEQTMVSFSALNGNPIDHHLGYHPLWELLRELPDTSATRLLPILNVGSVGQGEGFWPVIPLDLIDFAAAHMRRQPFAGAVVLTSFLSRPGTFLDGALWTAGHALWGEYAPRILLETWCKAYHPSLASLELLGDIWKAMRRLSGLQAVGKCSTEECRSFSESLVGELNRLQRTADECKGSIQEYFTYFARDARRQILHFLQSRHAPMVNVLNGDDLQESFWTAIQQSGGPGFGSGAKVSILSTPQKGSEGSAMRRIYEEVDVFSL
ncbi:putative uncharacterized protein [Waddlia chondrophila 2032/99]|uniref:Uncharacterized protein n=1 Tax=Waddlia chondrophila 2032/99 TaxID=765953 RepID=F8LBP5_9BACT|nr:putative uncharacterized protein [Waddlia chondrophila 2032/99]